MDKNANYEMAMSAARRVLTLMQPTNADPTEVRIAKEILRWASVAVGASAIAVVVLSAGLPEEGTIRVEISDDEHETSKNYYQPKNYD